MLDDLYNEMVKDHGSHPRNNRPMPDATCQAPGSTAPAATVSCCTSKWKTM